MRGTPTLCAGLDSSHLNAVCERLEQCSRYANWWETPGVQFNVCTPTGQAFKHFAAKAIATTPPITLAALGQTMDLFA